MTFSPLQFIRANPATQAFDEREERNRLRREEERTFATDEAIRTGLAENERARSDPVVGRLLDVPGAGETALNIQQQSAEREDEMERLAMTALGRGDMEVFRYYSDRSGLNVPPEIVNDARLRDLYSRGTLIAQRLYGRGNQGQAARFFNAFVQNGGDVQAAFGAVGSPAGRPRITATVADAVGNEVNLLVNSRGTPVTTNLPEGYVYAHDSSGNIVVVRMPGMPEPAPEIGTPGYGQQHILDPDANRYFAEPIEGLDPITGMLSPTPTTPAPAPTGQFTTGGALGNPYSGMTDDEIMRELERAEQGLPTTPGLQDPTPDDPFGFGLGGLFPTR